MLDTTEIAVFIALGLIFAGGAVALGLWSKLDPKRLAAYALFAVAFPYVGFAMRAEESAAWIGFEMTGVAVFG
ncbi:MAG: PTS sugar transporter subunit IIA, partial [Methylocystis sp.]|nr:PTS sugar transporter subunit IIA [Methylocystis sp.]